MNQKVYNINCESSYSEMLFHEFQVRNSDTSIRLKKLKNIWIPTQSIESLIDKLDSLNFITHCNRRSFNSVGVNSIINFSRNSSGLYDGTISYTKNEYMFILEHIISKSSDNSKRLRITWWTSADGDYEDIVDTSTNVTKNSLYPFIKDGADKYIEKFLNSSESILILIGEPGTGKTNFIRNILYSLGEKDTYLSFDEAVLKTDGIFVKFICDENAGAFVVEDADMLLKSRDSGSEHMSKFLNVGDGLVKLNGKKLIFSTNLESTSDIDPAITRPGRCYDVLNFRQLTADEAQVVCEEYGLDDLPEKKSYTLSEIFNREKTIKKRIFGFA